MMDEKNQTGLFYSINGNDTFHMTLSNNEPPAFRSSDYGEIILLTILIMVGGPLNLLSLFRTLRAAGYFDHFYISSQHAFSPRSQSFSIVGRRTSTMPAFNNVKRKPVDPNKPEQNGKKHKSSPPTSPRLLTFKLHLTCANLLIVFGYGVSQLGWLCTYSWMGGDILCKFTKFLHTFCFYATSNLVASIAIDRLHVMLNVDRPSGGINMRRQSKSALAISMNPQMTWLQRLVWSAWILAFASSIPQFFLWRTFEPYPNWEQCVNIWLVRVYSAENQLTFEDLMYYSRIYDAIHLALVFWIPASVIVLCYALVLAQLHKKIRSSNKDLKHLCKYRRESDAVVFRQKCEVLHRASVCSGGSTSGGGGATGNSDGDVGPATPNSPITPTATTSPPSAGLLMELPIVMSSIQPFLCKPSSESFAVVTLKRAKRNTMKKTAWILLAYAACWSPYQMLELYRYLIDSDFDNVYLQFLSNLIVFNAMVNPVIYGL